MSSVLALLTLFDGRGGVAGGGPIGLLGLVSLAATTAAPFTFLFVVVERLADLEGVLKVLFVVSLAAGGGVETILEALLVTRADMVMECR